MVTAGAAVLIGMVLLVAGITTTQAVLVLGVIVSVIEFLSILVGAALITRRLPQDCRDQPVQSVALSWIPGSGSMVQRWNLNMERPPHRWRILAACCSSPSFRTGTKTMA